MKTLSRLILPAALSCALLLTACGGDHKNRAPIASDSNVTTQADTVLNGVLPAVDADGNRLTFTAATQPTQGTLVVNADGSYVYTPNADTIGMDTFTFTAADKKTTSNVATVNITIGLLDVAFNTYSRQAYLQDGSAQPLPLNTRNVAQDVSDPTAYDDLLE